MHEIDLRGEAGQIGRLLQRGITAADDGAAEYVYRFAPLVGIYGGTLEVFRNMIGQHVLGLGKPNYSPPKKVS